MASTSLSCPGGSSYRSPIQFHRRPQLRLLEYWLGAPGVGRPLATCAPLSCALVSAPMTVMPVPEICAPTACDRASGAEMVIETPAACPPLPPGPPPKPPRPPPPETTTAVSR